MKKALLKAALLLGASTLCLQAQVTNIMQGLVSYWPMDTTYTNGSGQIYTPDVIQGNDFLVTVHDATHGAAQFVPGKFGNCISNTGSSLEIYYVTNWTGSMTDTNTGQGIGTNIEINTFQTASATGLPIAMTPTTNFTTSLWVWGLQANMASSTKLYSETTTNANDGNTYAGLECYTTSPFNHVVGFQRTPIDYAGSGSSTNGSSGNAPGPDYTTASGIIFPASSPSWHHVVQVVSNTTQYFYADGTLAGSGTWYPPCYYIRSNWVAQLSMTTLGCLLRDTTNVTSAGNLYIGLIDDVAVWNRALSPAEITYLATNTSGLGGATNALTFPPYFISTPVGGTLAACGNISMSGKAAAGTTPISQAGFTYQWQEDGTNVTAAEFSGQTTTTLSLTSAQAQDAGTYTLVATFAYITNAGALYSITSTPVVINVVTNPTYSYATTVGTTNLWPGDSWNLNVGVTVPCGVTPTYEWLQNGSVILQDGGDISGSATTNILFTGLDITNSGTYQLVVLFNGGANSVTSAPITMTVNSFSSSGETPNLTNGLMAYWPLYSIQGTKTPDEVNGYDMTVVGAISNTTDHTGSGTNAMLLGGSGQYFYRIDSTNDLLPALNYPAFSVSFWVQAQGGTTSANYGCGAFGMADTYGGASFLTLFGNTYVGNASQSMMMRPYYRVIGGSGYDLYFSGTVYDGNWHHVVYIQRPFGTNFPGLNPTANSGVNTKNVLCQMYMDGNLDPTSFFEIWPVTNSSEPHMNTDAIGTAVRNVGAGSTMLGSISDVAEWNRVLSAAEVQQLYTSGMPPITPNIPLMSISSFLADAPEIAQGGSVTLSWNTSAYATVISIDQGVGNVYSNSIQGVGSVTLTNLQHSKTYTLTVSRGTNVVTAQVAVGVLSGLNAGWKPLDTFDEYASGPFNGLPFWSGTFTYCEVVPDATGNKLLHLGQTTAVEPEIKFDLNGNTLTINQAATLFFRFVTGSNLMSSNGTSAVTPVDYVIGFSDWAGLRFYGDTTGDIGPNLYLGTDSGLFGVGAKDGYGNVVNWATGAGAVMQPDGTPLVLSNSTVYDVWLDVTNNNLVNVGPPNYNIWIAPENNLSNLTEVFTNYLADRATSPPAGSDHPQEVQNLSVVFMGGGSDDANGIPQVLLDDFYLNTNGYNHTVPRPYGLTTEQGVSPLVSITPVVSNGQIQLYWSGGVLASAPTVLGPWTPVAGASVPYYVVPPSNSQLFFATLPVP